MSDFADDDVVMRDLAPIGAALEVFHNGHFPAVQVAAGILSNDVVQHLA